MNNTLFSFPKPENEPVLGYKPGSPERKEIRKALDELYNMVTDIPAIASVRQYYNDNQLGYAYNAYNYSTARVADGGFIRMKDISLTYEFSPSLINKIGLNSASL